MILKGGDTADQDNPNAGRDLGILFGAVFCAILAYWCITALDLFANVVFFGINVGGLVTLATTVVGGILGTFPGGFLGRLVDTRLAPAFDSLLDAADESPKTRQKQHGRMWS